MASRALGVIDVGSNAIRLSLGEPTSKNRVKLVFNERDAIRLGADTFTDGMIKLETRHSLIKAFKRYKKIFSDHGIEHYRAVATSALREAQNGKEIISEILEKTGIKIDLISGPEEAKLIHLALANALGRPTKPMALMDIGGGSLEIIIASNNQLKFLNSFKVGTVRLLQMTKQNLYDRDFFTNTIRNAFETIPQIKVSIGAGSGGNVSRIGKLRKIILDKKNENEIRLIELEEIIERLFSSTQEERIEKFKMRPDRADVILPASIIILEFMKYFKLSRLEIPNTGLKEGVLLNLLSNL